MTHADRSPRAPLVRTGLEVLFNVLLPFAVFSLAQGRFGNVQALMAASAAPLIWSVVVFARERKLDAIALVALAGVALSLLAFAGGGGVRALQLRENLVAGLVGLVFLGSVAVGRPLIHPLAKAGARRRSGEEGLWIEVLGDEPGFRRAMTMATVVWGLGLVGLCALSCGLVLVLTIPQYLLAGGPVSYGVIGLLTAWTIWFVRRARREAEARRARPDQL